MSNTQLHQKFDADKFATKGSAANALRQGIWCRVNEMAEQIQSKQAGESRAKKSAELGAQVAILQAVQCFLTDLEIEG